MFIVFWSVINVPPEKVEVVHVAACKGKVAPVLN
jgi:hypothetical protein